MRFHDEYTLRSAEGPSILIADAVVARRLTQASFPTPAGRDARNTPTGNDSDLVRLSEHTAICDPRALSLIAARCVGCETYLHDAARELTAANDRWHRIVRAINDLLDPDPEVTYRSDQIRQIQRDINSAATVTAGRAQDLRSPADKAERGAWMRPSLDQCAPGRRHQPGAARRGSGQRDAHTCARGEPLTRHGQPDRGSARRARSRALMMRPRCRSHAGATGRVGFGAAHGKATQAPTRRSAALA